MSVVWASRLLGHRLPERIPLTYAIEDLATNWAARGFSVFLLGGTEGSAELAAGRLAERFPGVKVAGWHHGYFGDEDGDRVVELINVAKPDILLVGLGNPRQEIWVAQNLDRLDATATLTCGGLFDWLSGTRRPAPRWVGNVGMEWLYRLVIEPRRLFRRYVVGNPRFVWNVGRALVRGDRAAAIPAAPRVEPNIVIDLRDGVAPSERLRIDEPAEAAADRHSGDQVIDLTEPRTSVESTAPGGVTRDT
jgi:N-acetylglucosaminyldiphosphoundecaprenol N-acetyl-beta-D-mannosaminyltransferase